LRLPPAGLSDAPASPACFFCWEPDAGQTTIYCSGASGSTRTGLLPTVFAPRRPARDPALRPAGRDRRTATPTGGATPFRSGIRFSYRYARVESSRVGSIPPDTRAVFSSISQYLYYMFFIQGSSSSVEVEVWLVHNATTQSGHIRGNEAPSSYHFVLL
jgi:hypothetical protein